MKMRTIPMACLVVCVLIGAGVAGWKLNLRARSAYTDADRIRMAVADAPIRRILWQPAERVAGDADADQYEPRISADGSLMVFVRGRAGSNADLYQRRRTADGRGWSEPEAIAAINTPSDELGPELSRDGKTLYFYSDRAGGQGGYDIWVSRIGGQVPGDWSEPVNLGPAVNSPFNDYGPALGLDGATLYFSSNRPRSGEGAPQAEAWAATLREQRTRHDYDLYRADMGSGAAAEAIGELNTSFDEGAPAMSPAGDFLYFASDRPGGLGGFDVYRSRLLRGVLQTPEGLGLAINSVANDLDPAPATDGFRLFFSSDRTDSTQRMGESESASNRKAEAGTPVRYALWSSASREVFVEAEPLKAGDVLARLWGAAWPWLLALLMAALLGFGFSMAMRDAAMRRRLRQLSLMAKCVLVSLLIHAAILSGLAVWRVGTAIGEALHSGGGTRTMIGTLGSAGSDGGLAAQVRSAAATMEVRLPAFSTAAPTMVLPEIASTPVMITTAPTSLSILPPSTRLPAEEAPSSPQGPEARPAEASGAVSVVRAPRAESPREAVAEANRAEGSLGIMAAPAEIHGSMLGNTSVQVSPEAGSVLTVMPTSLRIDGDAGDSGAATTSSPAASVASINPSRAASATRLPSIAAGGSGSEAKGSVDGTLAGGAPAPVTGVAAKSESIAISPVSEGTPALGRASVELPVDEAPTEPRTQPSLGMTGIKDRPMVAVRMPANAGSSRGEPLAEAGASQATPSIGSAAPARPMIAASGTRNGSVSLAPTASNVKTPAAQGLNATLELRTAEDVTASAPPQSQIVQGMPKLGLPGARLPAMEKDQPQPAETFAQRAPEIREKVLEKTGGSKETERAVTLALEWFKTHQSDDGRWSGKHFDDKCGKCSGEAEIDSDASMTGMALLCFLGAGHTHAADGPYRQNVSKAINWLIRREDADGDLRRGETMYSQTIAAVALCEAYAMTRDANLQVPARRAVEFVARGPSRKDGRSAASDTSVLGWQIMSIKSAERAGFNVPTAAFDAARRWLDQTAQRGSSGRYGYRPGESPTAAATAEAMFVQQLLGHTRDEGRMAESARFILATPPSWRHEAPTHYWYYATLAMFQQQGDSWKQWNAALVKELLANQHQEDGLRGSWDPQDPWSRLGGRVYQTAVCTLSLEVYYRYRVGDEKGER